MAKTLADLVSLREVSKNVFETIHNPEKMGNNANIAYGGCALAVATKAAHQNLPEKYCLYSFMGNYLGPALCDRNLICTVQDIRTTRTFATRQVEVSQAQSDGQHRICMIAIADFQVAEPATLLNYSKPPTMEYSPSGNLLDSQALRQSLFETGKITKSINSAYKITFGLMGRFFDQRPCPESVWAQNLIGMAKANKTTQDHLSITSKTSADWIKIRHALDTKSNQCSALAFIMDGALSFIPLVHNHMFFDETGACSSLDFALRFFGNEPNLNEWHLRELKTITGGEGRTYSEAQLWDESGVMVASMTQQSIMRPKAPSKSNL